MQNEQRPMATMQFNFTEMKVKCCDKWWMRAFMESIFTGTWVLPSFVSIDHPIYLPHVIACQHALTRFLLSASLNRNWWNSTNAATSLVSIFAFRFHHHRCSAHAFQAFTSWTSGNTNSCGINLIMLLNEYISRQSLASNKIESNIIPN